MATIIRSALSRNNPVYQEYRIIFQYDVEYLYDPQENRERGKFKAHRKFLEAATDRVSSRAV